MQEASTNEMMVEDHYRQAMATLGTAITGVAIVLGATAMAAARSKRRGPAVR
jgi:nitrate reductase gamma subunit